MPQVADNADGTTTFSITSTELKGIKEVLDRNVPNLKGALQWLDSPEVKDTLAFLRSALSD